MWQNEAEIELRKGDSKPDPKTTCSPAGRRLAVVRDVAVQVRNKAPRILPHQQSLTVVTNTTTAMSISSSNRNCMGY
jgi:hypothetical protein